MQKGILTLIGFLLFLFGFLSIVLSMIGVQLAWLSWLDLPGPLFGFVSRLVMIIAGVILVVVAQTDWKKERAESR